MNVVFRTDASIDIGTGHVMRCLTLAAALRERGAACRFVCRAHSGHLIDVIRQRGFVVATLPVSPLPVVDLQLRHSAWLGSDQASDARETLATMAGQAVDWLIADHYGLGLAWERALRPACRRIMVIDDLADRRHDCDLLLDQNLGRLASDYDGLVSRSCRLRIGPVYALLRPEFAAVRSRSLARRAALPGIRRLLVTMGGVDKDNATGKALGALNTASLPSDCRICVVMGRHAPWLRQVREQLAGLPWATEMQVDVRDMAGLMADSDLAIGAAGTSAWERCCLGLPTLVAVLADNQRQCAAALAAAGCVLLLDDDSGLGFADLSAKLVQLTEQERLGAMQRACAQLTDGMGAASMAEELVHVGD